MLLLTFLLFIAVLAVYVIWHMRMQKMREYKRRKYKAESELSEKLNITTVLPDLTKDEMKKIAVEEKAKKEGEEAIDLDRYEGLPLKPKVYFDPEKDPSGDEPPPEPKIKRSFLSNEPLPKAEDEPVEETVVGREVENEEEDEGLWGSIEIDQPQEGDEPLEAQTEPEENGDKQVED
jgi:hypothetical protein